MYEFHSSLQTILFSLAAQAQKLLCEWLQFNKVWSEEAWCRESTGCAHLHSVRGRRGRSLYRRGTGSFRQSWRRNGRRCGQRSTRQCLHADTNTHFQKNTTKDEKWHIAVLFCSHRLLWLAAGWVLWCRKKMAFERKTSPVCYRLQWSTSWRTDFDHFEAQKWNFQ